MSTRRHAYFGLLAAGGVAALGVLTAAPAAAHVTVQPGEAPKGGYAKLAFRVPNESSTAGTIKLDVSFPQQTPLTSVRTKPMPGWTATVSREPTGAVRAVSWTAQPGVRIGPGEFTEFEVSAGPLPGGADRLLFPAAQTYDDGRVVNWAAPPADGGATEPEHPAPVLTLLAAATDHAHGDAAQSSPDQTAHWVGGTGLAVGALGLGVAAGALLAGRRRPGAADSTGGTS